jgi:chaperonin GroES
MKAIGNNIVILPKKLAVTDKTKGGLLLKESDKENIRYKQAIIISISDEIKFMEVGDEIYYDKHAGHEIEFEGDNYTVIKISDVVAVL